MLFLLRPCRKPCYHDTCTIWTLSSKCITSLPRQKIQCIHRDVTIAWFCKGSKYKKHKHTTMVYNNWMADKKQFKFWTSNSPIFKCPLFRSVFKIYDFQVLLEHFVRNRLSDKSRPRDLHRAPREKKCQIHQMSQSPHHLVRILRQIIFAGEGLQK